MNITSIPTSSEARLLETRDLLPILANSENTLIVDLSRREVYDQVHVPGAVWLDFRQLQAGTAPAPGDIPSEKRLSTMLSEIGLKPNMRVIAYDDEGGGWAGRFLWTLEMVGHTNYAYMNGGIHAWLADQLPAENAPNEAKPSNYQAKIIGTDMMRKEDIMSALGNDDFIVWDARSYDEYTGGRMFAQKGGHIPGAAHFEWVSLMDKANNMRLKPLDAIQNVLNDLGLTQDKTIVTHCQTHHRSGLTWLVAKILGYPNIKAYAPSWAEWGNDPDTPVESLI